MKTCSKCGETKPIAEFVRGRRTCKVCKTEYDKSYYEATKELRAERWPAYYEANKQARLEQQATYYEANKEAILEKRAAYCEENKETIAQRDAAYYEANKEAILEKKAAYYEDNKESISEKYATYYENNKQIVLDRNAIYAKSNPEVLRARAHRRRTAKAGNLEFYAPGTVLATAQDELDAFEATNGMCFWECGRPATELEHIVPIMGTMIRGHGGAHTASNLVPSCIPCNRGQGGKLAQDPLVFLFRSREAREE